MKVFILLCLAAVALSGPQPQYSLDKAEGYFQEFIETYNKQYVDEAEKSNRFEIFKENLIKINLQNSENSTAVFGINFFSDLRIEEVVEIYTGLNSGPPLKSHKCEPLVPTKGSAPDAWDWRDHGIISTPKNQGSCGSCWAFSAIGNLEAIHALRTKELLDLSEQQLVDCDKNSEGCIGTRNIEYPFMYMKKKGVMQEKDYPYVAENDTCKYDKSKVIIKTKKCLSFIVESEEQLKLVLYQVGPLTFGLDPSTWVQYHHGIVSDCPFVQMLHAVLLVGYGTENGVPFWVLKNSWGTGFGEKGFVRIKRGVNACGMMKSRFLRVHLKDEALGYSPLSV